MIIFNMMMVRLTATIIIETALATLLKIRNKKDILNIVLVNLFTNPLLVISTFTLKIYYGQTVYNISLLIAEILVLFIEGKIYQLYLTNRNINPYLLSFLLNLSSFLSGYLLIVLNI